MSSGDIKELNRRDANNQWSVKMFVVNGEEQELFVKALDQAVGLWDTPKPEENE